MSDLVGNPGDRFFRVTAHMYMFVNYIKPALKQTSNELNNTLFRNSELLVLYALDLLLTNKLPFE